MNTLTIFYLFSECANIKSTESKDNSQEAEEDAATNFSKVIVMQENDSEVIETDIKS